MKHLFFVLIFVLCALFAQAQVQYTHEQWNDEQGLPENTVNDVLQSKDGYIWVATYEGISRFDGLNFYTYDKSNLPELKVNLIYCIAEDADGYLWIGTNGGGLLCFKGGKAKCYSFKTGELPSDVVRDVLVDKNNQVWATTDGGLISIKNRERIEHYPESGAGSNRLFEAHNGHIYMSNRAGGLQVFDGHKVIKRYTAEDGLGIETVMAFAEANGSIWAGSRGGLFKLENGNIKKMNDVLGSKDLSVVTLHHDPKTDMLYVGTNHAQIIMLKNEKIFEYLSASQALNLSVNVQGICTDHEGSIWYGLYKAGLHRIKRAKLTTLTPANSALSDNILKLVTTNAKSELFVATNNNGLDVLLPKYKNYGAKIGMKTFSVNSLLVDKQERIWLGTYHGWLHLIDNDKLTLLDSTNGLRDDFVSAIYQDSKDTVWVGCYGGGVYTTSNGQVLTHYKDAKGNDTLKNAIIRFFYEDTHKNLWIGTNAGLFLVENNIITKHFNVKNGLSLDMVISVYEDKQRDGLWFGTRGGGLNFIKNKEIKASIAEKEGLFNDVVYQIIDDQRGKLWMSCNKGIYCVPLALLHDFLDKKIKQIACESYDKSDGMLSTQCSGGFSPAGTRTADGKLWFPTVNGLVVIDPSRIQINRAPPPVHITHFFTDKLKHEVSDDVKVYEFEDLQDRIEFHYTGLSFLAPEKVRFKYILEGFDKDWIDAGARRVAYYTRLPYGDYTFRVMACNNDGVWNEIGDALQISIPAPFWLKPWFIALCCLVFVACVVGVIRFRIYNLEKAKKQLELLVDEKTVEIRRERDIVALKNQQIQEREEETIRQSKIIEQRNINIMDSIYYAKRIQEALLPLLDDIKHSFPSSFVLLLPKDVISGDSYWFTEQAIYDKNEQPLYHLHILVAFDCTGHGVPGAFMTVMGHSLLSEIIRTLRISSPEAILNEMDKRLRNSLYKSEKHSANDGMEMGIFSYCSIHKDIYFSSAGIPLYRVRAGALSEVGRRGRSLGGKSLKIQKSYELNVIGEVLKSDVFFMCSDGFQDQFGGTDDRKFMKRSLKNKLTEVATMPIQEQSNYLKMIHLEWRGATVQTDDILVVGIQDLGQ